MAARATSRDDPACILPSARATRPGLLSLQCQVILSFFVAAKTAAGLQGVGRLAGRPTPFPYLARRPPVPMVDRSRITDAEGRHIPVTRAALPRKAEAVQVGAPRSPRELRRRLDELASRVRRLAPPETRRPEKFHEERSEIARELQKLAEMIKD